MENSAHPIHPIMDMNQNLSGLIGLTKREYFAGLAMQGMLASMTEKASIGNWGTEQDILAQKSIEIADELLKQLEK